MGALEEKRSDALVQRFMNFEDPSGETPRFMYGTHYSTIGAVVYFLLRQEPFAGHAIALQGGHFDYADRLFHSIPEAFRNVMTR